MIQDSTGKFPIIKQQIEKRDLDNKRISNLYTQCLEEKLPISEYSDSKQKNEN